MKCRQHRFQLFFEQLNTNCQAIHGKGINNLISGIYFTSAGRNNREGTTGATIPAENAVEYSQPHRYNL